MLVTQKREKIVKDEVLCGTQWFLLRCNALGYRPFGLRRCRRPSVRGRCRSFVCHHYIYDWYAIFSCALTWQACLQSGNALLPKKLLTKLATHLGKVWLAPILKIRLPLSLPCTRSWWFTLISKGAHWSVWCISARNWPSWWTSHFVCFLLTNKFSPLERKLSGKGLTGPMPDTFNNLRLLVSM